MYEAEKSLRVSHGDNMAPKGIVGDTSILPGIVNPRECAAFIKRMTPSLWPMRGRGGEKLSDGVPKDQISALAHSCMSSNALK